MPSISSGVQCVTPFRRQVLLCVYSGHFLTCIDMYVHDHTFTQISLEFGDPGPWHECPVSVLGCVGFG